MRGEDTDDTRCSKCSAPGIAIIIMVIIKCYFSREHIALSYKKWCEHGIRKNQQIESTVHDGKSHLKKKNYVSMNLDKA